MGVHPQAWGHKLRLQVVLVQGFLQLPGLLLDLLLGYDGPLSIEWEDSGMERIFGGTEACAFTKKINFSPSNVAFDDAMKTD